MPLEITELKKIRWQTACLTYGNDHHTLIGLVVDWWISAKPSTRRALDEGPGIVGGRCDAFLCEDDVPTGVVEVEGIKPEATLDKTCRFLKAQDYPDLQFGLLVFYDYWPEGRGVKREFHHHESPVLVQKALGIVQELPNKSIGLIHITKRLVRKPCLAVRRRNDFYCGSVTRVDAWIIRPGDAPEQGVLCINELEE